MPHLSQQTSRKLPTTMKWPFKILALAVIIPTAVAILMVCIALWYGCYYRPRQRRQQEHNEQQQRGCDYAQGQSTRLPDPLTLTLASADPIDLEFTQNLESPKQCVVDNEIGGRNGYEEDSVYVPTNVPTSAASMSQSSSVSSLGWDEQVAPINVSRRRD